MHRGHILSIIAKKIQAKSYLEIGVSTGIIFDKIEIQNKVGVDPDPRSAATLHMGSDDYFNNNNETFDLIFIDGLHHADQVEKDIINSLDRLNDNGYIVCHDMLPKNHKMQTTPREPKVIEWTGDCWKAWVKIRSNRNNLNMFTVDTDYGCGIITKGYQTPIKIDLPLTYENFVLNKQKWMNIISVDEFKQIMGQNYEVD